MQILYRFYPAYFSIYDVRRTPNFPTSWQNTSPITWYNAPYFSTARAILNVSSPLFSSRFCYLCRMWRVIMAEFKAPWKTCNPLWKAEIRRRRRKLLSPEPSKRLVDSIKDICLSTVSRYCMQLQSHKLLFFFLFLNYISKSGGFYWIVLSVWWKPILPFLFFVLFWLL